MNTEKKKDTFFQVITRIIPMQFQAAPFNCILENILAVMHGLSFSLTVVATQHLFDTISKASAREAGFSDCMASLFLLTGATFGQQLLNGIHNFHGTGILFPKSSGKLTVLLHRKLKNIDPAQFENTDFLDDLNKAREGIQAIPLCCMILFLCVSFYGVYFLSIGTYLFTLKPMLLITLLLAFIPAIMAQTINIRVFTRLEEQSAPLRREHEYYQKAICDREYFKETRILGAFSFFNQLFTDTLEQLTSKIWRAERKIALLQLVLNITTFAGMGTSAYLLFTATMNGEITVGMFAAVFAALGQIFDIMNEIVSKHIGSMNRDIGKINNFLHLLDMPDRTGSLSTPDFTKGVAAYGISYTYPGRENPAVKNVSLNLAEGETIARGLYRVNKFIVLDEPTSAIDPIEETRIYKQFQRLAEGKCALVVTHRLGSAKLADRVVVLEAGEIVDMGTHDELLSRPGKYADMWAAQAQWYEREEELL